MELLVGWIIFAIVVAIIAGARGRSRFGWFLIALLITPVLGLILVVCLPARRNVLADRDRQWGRVKDCPRCAETVKSAAKVCRYCGHDFEQKVRPRAA